MVGAWPRGRMLMLGFCGSEGWHGGRGCFDEVDERGGGALGD